MTQQELELPKGWVETTLEQCVDILDGKRIPINSKERAKRKGEIPYYGATGQVDSINDYKFDGRFLLITEDASLSNPINRKKSIAFIVQGKFWVNNHAHVVQTNEELDLDFLCYYINSIQIMDYAQKQETRAKLNKTSLEKGRAEIEELTKSTIELSGRRRNFTAETRAFFTEIVFFEIQDTAFLWVVK